MLSLPSGLSTCFPTKILPVFIICHALPNQSALFGHSNSIWQKEQIMKFLMKFYWPPVHF
jgi:hypothetical protein